MYEHRYVGRYQVPTTPLLARSPHLEIVMLMDYDTPSKSLRDRCSQVVQILRFFCRGQTKKLVTNVDEVHWGVGRTMKGP